MKKTWPLLLVLLVAAPAFGKPARKRAPTPPPVSDFTVPVPIAEIELRGEEPEDETKKPFFELGLSTWEPSDFRRSGYQRQESAFRAGSPPFIALGVKFPWANYSNGAGFSYRMGLAARGLERYQALAPGALIEAEQKLQLFFLRAGLEYGGPRFLGRVLQPYLGFSLLPALALSSPSPIERQVSALGLGMEGEAGLRVHPGFLRDVWGMTHGAFSFSAHYLFGSVDGSRLDGFGVQGALQVNL